MVQNLINSAYNMEPDNLVYDADKTIDATVISMTSPQTVLKRGTLLGITSDYDYVIYGTPDTTSAPCYIVSDTLDVTKETGRVEVGAYIAGYFRKEAVIVADGYDMTEGDMQELRKLGIILK